MGVHWCRGGQRPSEQVLIRRGPHCLCTPHPSSLGPPLAGRSPIPTQIERPCTNSPLSWEGRQMPRAEQTVNSILFMIFYSDYARVCCAKRQDFEWQHVKRAAGTGNRKNGSLRFVSETSWSLLSSAYVDVYVLVAQLCPTLCHPMDCSPPGSSVHGILQARTLEWVAIPLSRGSSQPKNQTRGLLHWRQILYHLGHQGRPTHWVDIYK